MAGVNDGVLSFWGRVLLLTFVAGTLLLYSARSGHAQNEAEKWPSTLEEAVSTIVAELSGKDTETLCRTKKEDLILYHHGWGTGIRNSFGLWGGNKALLRSACGGELCHPDDASMIIIEGVWTRLQETTCAKQQRTP